MAEEPSRKQKSTQYKISQTHFTISMAEEPAKRVAVVTGGNKGIGFEICRQLASNGVCVILTARDEKRGIAAVEELKESGFSDLVVFHCLDVANPKSIDSLADFVKSRFGKLDILVNNAAIGGTITDGETLLAIIRTSEGNEEGAKINWNELITETYELAEDCIKTNYYGAKRMVEAFIPLLCLSDSPRIVNVSSSMGKLKNVTNEWAKGLLEDAETLTEEKIDEVLNELLKDFKECSLQSKGWPTMSAYIVSKAALNAYTRILAKKYPSVCINCVCPGFVKTDINHNTGTLTVEEGAESPVRLALLPDGSPSGLFYFRKEIVPF